MSKAMLRKITSLMLVLVLSVGSFVFVGAVTPNADAAIMHITDATADAGSVTVELRLETGADFAGMGGGEIEIEYDSAILHRPAGSFIVNTAVWDGWDPVMNPAPAPTATDTGLARVGFLINTNPMGMIIDDSVLIASITFQVRDGLDFGTDDYLETPVTIHEVEPLADMSFGPISTANGTVRINAPEMFVDYDFDPVDTTVSTAAASASDATVAAYLVALFGTAEVETTVDYRDIPVTWTVDGTFNAAEGATNTFNWSIAAGLTDANIVFDPPAPNGSIEVTNYAAVVALPVISVSASAPAGGMAGSNTRTITVDPTAVNAAGDNLVSAAFPAGYNIVVSYTFGGSQFFSVLPATALYNNQTAIYYPTGTTAILVQLVQGRSAIVGGSDNPVGIWPLPGAGN